MSTIKRYLICNPRARFMYGGFTPAYYNGLSESGEPLFSDYALAVRFKTRKEATTVLETVCPESCYLLTVEVTK